MRALLFVLSCLLLSACSSIPENLESDSATLVTDYQIWRHTDPSKKFDVRLGGMVIKVDNQKETTRLEVVNIPLDKSGRPRLDQKPQGRFVAYLDGFIDPVNVAPKTFVTFLGKTQNNEPGKIGEYEYEYPVMKVNQLRVWQKEQVSYVNPQWNACYSGYYRGRHGGFYPGFCTGFYGPQRIDTYEVLR